MGPGCEWEQGGGAATTSSGSRAFVRPLTVRMVASGHALIREESKYDVRRSSEEEEEEWNEDAWK